jgi:endothelin-converting enzyme/putative endopeptidase
MDAATRSRALAKLDRMTELVGYGGEVPDYGPLRVQRDSYFRDLVSAKRFALAEEVERAGRGVERGAWPWGPAEDRARYIPWRNTLVLPAGLFQSPIDNPEAPPSLVFGAVGVRIGRALLESLEGEGRFYDGAGRVLDWWSPATATEFEAELSCFSKEEGAKETDAALVGLADEGGLRLAWEAMQTDRVVHPGLDRKLHGFSPDQQFFLGWAQSLCAVGAGEEGAEAPQGTLSARQRVNGAVSNLSEFSITFRCGKKSELNRAAVDGCEAF